MTRRTIGRLALSLIVFVLCAELLALLWYGARTGSLFYVRPDVEQETVVAPQDQLATEIAVHPYFGFAHIPNAGFHDERTERLKRQGWPAEEAAKSRTNNFGFISPLAYPVEKTRDNQFFVGIFGGSVGMWFCQVGVPHLISELREQPFFQDKEIVPLCFSFSGYKQPQLALVLGYFLAIGQRFDLVVNIDGFNDVALGALNDARGADVSMPSIQHLGGLVNVVNHSTMTPDKLEALTGIVRDRARLVNLSHTIRTNRSAAIDFVLNAYYSRAQMRYAADLARYDALPSNPVQNSLIQVTPPTAARDRTRMFADIAALWTRSSLQMRDLLATHGSAYVHVLQPNQYFTTRRFSEAEAATALSDASPYKRSVEEGYPVLQAEARSTLVGNKVSFFDATAILDREAEQVYVDDCCHYTLTGNRLLAEFIVTAIRSTPGPWNP